MGEGQEAKDERIALTIQREMVSGETALYGLVVVMKSWVTGPLSVLVRAMYHFRARTGHHNLSSVTDENDLISGMKSGGGGV